MLTLKGWSRCSGSGSVQAGHTLNTMSRSSLRCSTMSAGTGTGMLQMQINICAVGEQAS